jgi:hypothetical protein
MNSMLYNSGNGRNAKMPRQAIYCALLSGILASIVCQFFFWVFNPWLNRVSNLPNRARGVPGYITGYIESFAFGAAFPIAPSEVGTAAMAWLALKLIPYWQLGPSIAEPAERELHGHYGFKALITGFANLVLAAGTGYVVFSFCIGRLR